MSWYFEPTKPIETTKGIKAKSKRGKFVENWWATRWIEALERLMDRGRLSRGRRYARKGQVTSLEETKDGIAAKVQGSRRTPYKVSIKLQGLTDKQWTAVLDALAERARKGEITKEEAIERSKQVARDSWFAGFSDRLLAVVWLGRDDNSPINLTGSSGALRVSMTLAMETPAFRRVTAVR